MGTNAASCTALRGTTVATATALAVIILAPRIAGAQERAPGTQATRPPASELRVLTPDTYDSWRTILAPVLSPDGNWAGFTITPAAGDGEAVFRATRRSTEYRIPRGFTGRPMLTTTGTPFRAPPVAFTADSRHAVLLAYAPRSAFDSARHAHRKSMPHPRLVLLDLGDGTRTQVENVAAFSLPRDNSDWLVYTVARDRPDSGGADTTLAHAAALPGGQPHPIAPAAPRDGSKRAGRADSSATIVIRSVRTGAETRIDSVGGYAMDPLGRWIAYAVTGPDSVQGAYVRSLASGRTAPLLRGRGRYRGLTVDSAGSQVAFVSDRDDRAAATGGRPAFSLYVANVAANGAGAQDVAATLHRGVAAGAFGRDTIISADSIAFSHRGTLLSFGVAPVIPDSIPADSLADKAVYDLWNYRDPRLQPEQKLQAAADRKRAFLTVYHTRGGGVVRVGNDSAPGAVIGGDGRYALIRNESPYAVAEMWGEGATDAVVVDLANGRRQTVARRLPFPPTLSDGGRYVVWFDSTGWFAHSIAGNRTVRMNDRIPGVRFEQETWDTPSPAAPWGLAGFTRGDARVLVYDRHDIWSLDPAGAAAPVLLTDSAGARNNLVLRLVERSRDRGRDRGRDGGTSPIDPRATVLLSAVNDSTRASGFFRTSLGTRHTPEQLVMADAQYGTPEVSRDSSEYLVTRETVAEFPDLYVGQTLASLSRITNANPQQSQYRWPTVEMVHWRSDDGIPLRGLLYRPAGFDASRQYPMIVYYYERLSDQVHRYPVPAGRNVVNPSVYASHGYLVFFPDIAYTTGYPGMSAVKSIVPGVQMLVRRGFVKPDAIGCAGQSWGGYQGAFMVTQTTLFRACFVGAPVANMTSAYGGVRWESGHSRQGQYEHTQSRIGGSLWAYRDRYIENSPLFYADRIHTPLLIMANDADGAVPWYQGIEFFTALKRLGKEAYLVDYNGDAHNPVKDANRKDIDSKMLQFFAHHLEGAPAPEWMTKGIPFLQKGRDQLAPAAPAAPPSSPGSEHR